MTACPHDLTEREIAVTADGECSICLRTEVARLREEAVTYRHAQHYWEDRAVKAEAVLDRLAGVTVDDILVAIKFCLTDREEAAAVLALVRARVEAR